MTWTPELETYRDRFAAIGARLRPQSVEAWRSRSFPWELWDTLAEEGLLTAATRTGWGYHEGCVRIAAALEGLTYATRDGGFPISVLCHAVLAATTIDRFAGDAVRMDYRHRMEEGGEIASFAVTEPKGGSDALNPDTSLRLLPDGSGVLNGRKWHITNAPHASVVVTFAMETRTGHLAAVVLDAVAEGVEVSAPLRPVGARSSPVASFTFRNVAIPATHVLGLGERARTILRDAFLAERVLSAFPCLGGLAFTLGHAVAYSRKRRVFGRRIGEYQHVQRRITDIKVGLETVRCLAHDTLTRFAKGEDVSLEASLVKMHATRVMRDAVLDAIALQGSYGLQEEEDGDMALLDALAATIGGGTEEVHRNVIYQELVARQGRRRRAVERPAGASSRQPAPAAVSSDVR